MEAIIHEGRFFLTSVFTGILLLFAYDFFRILRAIIPHKKWVIFWQDYLFWLLSGFFVFLMIYHLNSGSIRGFCFMGILLVIHNRHTVLLTGVNDVLSFDASEIILDTVQGMLMMRGEELHVNRLSLEKGEVDVDGTIDSFAYADDRKTAKGSESLLSRLFK